MKPKAKIQKLGYPRSSRHLNDNWLGKIAFGTDEEPRGHNGGMKKGKKENVK